jgi:hypothetical protein
MAQFCSMIHVSLRLLKYLYSSFNSPVDLEDIYSPIAGMLKRI